ncbi:MAG: Ig-like domain-containing protein [Clostridia bacterium]|nr:Ig-like domain-containing protein [Clostridia bacterium]
MKTSHGKLAMLAFVLLMAALLLAPMRAGQEDELVLRPGTLKLSAGGSYRVSCALRSDDPKQTLRFSSGDMGVATIAADGTVTGHAPGETTITARASGGAQATMKVVVDGTPLTELSLNTDEVYLEKGQFSGLSVSYNADASDARLQWISADESVAKVDAAGRIEGVGGGETVISVVSPNGRSASARVFVNVDGEAAHITPNGLTLGVGAKVPLRVSYLPEDATDKARRWSSSDESVLTVDGAGVLQAKGVGRAYVSLLTEDGLTTGMEVIVEAAPEDIQLDPAKATIERGDTLDLQLMFENKDGEMEKKNHLVVWSSSDESIAKVDENGRVTALRSGSCEITASADGMSARCRLEVQVTIHEIALRESEIFLLREETGEPIQLEWSIDPVDADDPSVRFASDNEQVARVSETGLITLSGGYGTAVITVSSASGATAEFTVNVVTSLPDATPEPTEIPVVTEVPAATQAPVVTEAPAVQNAAPAAVG